MELENQRTRQAYILLLIDTLKKKFEVLNRLTDLTRQQETILNNDSFNNEQFLETINSKEEQIKYLNKLDDGFDQIYQGVKTELFEFKEKYGSEISMLKELISSITDAGVNLQAMERRNKLKAEAVFSKRHKDIRNSKISSQTVTNYYKTMSMQQEAQSYFYDKKK
jgi:flagellar biosynthesis/type III secretory pathway chaperone